MDSKKTIAELKKEVQEFCEKRDWDKYHNPKELAIGISTESSELLEMFRFKDDKEMKNLLSDPEKKELIKNELADIQFFILRFAQMNNIDISESFKKKMIQNEKKYPVHKSKGSNKKYDEL